MAQKKLTKNELINLHQLISEVSSIKYNLAQICLEKELDIKKIKKQFNKNWKLLNFNIQQSEIKQQDFVKKLTSKYGKDKTFNLDTGEIKNQ